MPKSYALHIGLNQVDATHYNNWNGKLKHAEADAFVMHEISSNQSFDEQELLLTKKATRENVLRGIIDLSVKAEKGDLVVITYSGHGSFLPDLNSDEVNALDETWCCYDGMVVDDELLFCWSRFQAGVRVFLVSDSCHSGDIAKGDDDAAWTAEQAGAKFLPIEKSLPIYKANKAFYDKIATDTPIIDPKTLVASIKQLGGCNENSFSYEGAGNGMLTIAIKKAWDNSEFVGDYTAFFDAVQKNIDLTMQQPVLLNIGADDADFDALKPFSVVPNRPLEFISFDSNTEGVVELLVDFGKAAKANLSDMTTHHQGANYAIGKKEIGVFTSKSKAANNAWDEAHILYDDFKAKGVQVNFVEPNISHPTTKLDNVLAAKSGGGFTFYESWPHPKTETFDKMWHLGSDYSQLADARDSLMNDEAFIAKLTAKPIRIAHIDTGYFPFKDFVPEKLLAGLCKSFVSGEETNLAFDYIKGGLLPESQGHGAATLALLAGPKVSAPRGLESYSGYVGAIPFAEIISIRINDCVALLKTRAFEQAIYYAVEQKCEVITMSMAGAPSKRWAEAVNFAYESGVTVVSATGDSWRKTMMKYLPKTLLFPARFERVIGVAGTTFTNKPYVFEANNWERNAKAATGDDMQGNYGPRAQMHHVMSGYTPNMLWANSGQGKNSVPPFYDLQGGGTSAATPQIAAAAAMWIAKHRAELDQKGYGGTWRQVEAVRKALFDSTSTDSQGYFDYTGRGSLRAADALTHAPADETLLTMSPEADTPFLPIIRTLFGLLGDKSGNAERSMDDVKSEMFALEIAQLVVTEPQLADFSEIDFQNADALLDLSSEDLAALKKGIRESANASEVLKIALKVSEK